MFGVCFTGKIFLPVLSCQRCISGTTTTETILLHNMVSLISFYTFPPAPKPRFFAMVVRMLFMLPRIFLISQTMSKFWILFWLRRGLCMLLKLYFPGIIHRFKRLKAPGLPVGILCLGTSTLISVANIVYQKYTIPHIS